jgi:hypothetical protein
MIKEDIQYDGGNKVNISKKLKRSEETLSRYFPAKKAS